LKPSTGTRSSKAKTRSPITPLIELREAIEELGGTLTAEPTTQVSSRVANRLRCFTEARRAARVATDREVIAIPAARAEPGMPSSPARRERQPGRNERCWCGSARKYKKCHLATDENTHRGSR